MIIRILHLFALHSVGKPSSYLPSHSPVRQVRYVRSGHQYGTAIASSDYRANTQGYNPAITDIDEGTRVRRSSVLFIWEYS
jgi:hypothetical protein